jgi:hypothetical protein
MKRLLSLTLAALLMAALGGMTSASAATARASFDWHAGDNFGGFLESPDVAMAANGDTITIMAGGSFDVAARTATGTGSFVHRSSIGATMATGTLTATRLYSFQFYGCGTAGGQPIPPDFCGGRALIAVHIAATTATGAHVEADGTLTVDCLLGSPPAGAGEGVTLNVKDLLNFNKEVSGETLFVKTS